MARTHADQKYKSPEKREDDHALRELTSNNLYFSLEKEIEEIKEDPNETFASFNQAKIRLDDSSLFQSPLISNNKQEKLSTSNHRKVQISPKVLSKNLSSQPSVSFRRKESSENQIKEMFTTSPLISSPEFENKNMLNFYVENYEDQNDKESYSFYVNEAIDSEGEQADISSIQRISESKMNISESNNQKINKELNPKVTIVAIRSIANILKKVYRKHVKYSLEEINKYVNFEKLKKENEEKQIEKQTQYNQSLRVLSVVVKQIKNKQLMQAMNAISRFSSEQKLVQTKAEISGEYKRLSIENTITENVKIDNVQLLALLKDSDIHKKLKKLFEILQKELQKGKFDAYYKLKSMQFCSINKLKKLENEKENQIKELEESMKNKFNQIQNQEKQKSEKMQDAINKLSQKNNQYKTFLTKAAFKTVIKVLSRDTKSQMQYFFQKLRELSKQMMSVSKPLYDKESPKKTSVKSEIDLIQATPRTVDYTKSKYKHFSNLSRE